MAFLAIAGNALSTIVSLSLGIYSTWWSCTADEASGVDVANSVVLILNAFVNSWQCCVAVQNKDDEEKQADADTWSTFTEALVTVIIMIITLAKVDNMGGDDFVACFVTIIIAVDAMLDTIVDMAVDASEEDGGIEYYASLVYSVTYNMGLAIWAGKLMDQATNEWENGDDYNGASYEADLKTYKDLDYVKLFKDVKGKKDETYDKSKPGNYCFQDSHTSFWVAFYQLQIP